jgi:hypothetical protein
VWPPCWLGRLRGVPLVLLFFTTRNNNDTNTTPYFLPFLSFLVFFLSFFLESEPSSRSSSLHACVERNRR